MSAVINPAPDNTQAEITQTSQTSVVPAGEAQLAAGQVGETPAPPSFELPSDRALAAELNECVKAIETQVLGNVRVQTSELTAVRDRLTELTPRVHRLPPDEQNTVRSSLQSFVPRVEQTIRAKTRSGNVPPGSIVVYNEILERLRQLTNKPA